MDSSRALETYYKYFIQDIRAYIRANPSDCFLISFPKSGGTWLKLILVKYMIETYRLDERETVRILYLTSKYKQLPKLIWTHDDSEIILENGELCNPTKIFTYGLRLRYYKNKVILLVRDPRDIAVSHYHQVTKRTVNPMKFNNISDFLRDPIYGLDRVVKFYNIWARNRKFVNKFLLITYEDLLENGLQEVCRIVDFLGIPNLNKSLIAHIYSEFSAEKMRQKELKREIDGMKYFSDDENSLKVRKARKGTYKEELSEDDIDYCNDRLKKLSKFYPYLA